MDEHAVALRDALGRDDAKAAWKSLERFHRSVSQGKVSDEDMLLVLPHLDAMAATGRSVNMYYLTDLRRLVLRNPSLYPAAGAWENTRQLAAQRVQEQEAEANRQARVSEARSVAARHLPMATTPDLPGREIERALTLVSGSCVMSRNAFSDIGSDFKSGFGGTLGGIEKAIESARATAQQRLEEAAQSLDADAVVGIDLTVQTVTDKAQLVMLMGTAVVLRPQSTPLDSVEADARS
jgi:uncharacterized protein YbjQ (UPF0145 family)